MIEQRVSSLEEKMARVETKIDRIELKLAELVGMLSQSPKTSDYTSLKTDLAEVKGRIASLPSTWQMLTMILASQASWAGIVFALLKFGTK